MKEFFRRYSPFLALLGITAFLFGVLPVGQTLWSRVLGVSGSVHTRGWKGCPPHFWKQKDHFADWPSPYKPSDLFGTAFDETRSDSGLTLSQALDLEGGGSKDLVREAVAALLNASNDNIEYAFSKDQVLSMLRDALASGDPALVDTTSARFAAANNAGCPLQDRELTETATPTRSATPTATATETALPTVAETATPTTTEAMQPTETPLPMPTDTIEPLSPTPTYTLGPAATETSVPTTEGG